MKEGNKYSIAILGSGESGMGALRLAAKNDMKCFLSDFGSMGSELKQEIEALGVPFEDGGHTFDKLKNYDVIVKSPGIPESAPIIGELRIVGIPIISEIEFASRFTDAKLIGITGSNGKTTTTLLTTHLLKQGGLDAVSAGNVGNSLSNLLVNESPDVIVLELSSFQLDDVAGFRPEIGVILNITPDHMDRYDHNMSKYADAKFNLSKYMTIDHLLILNTDDDVINERIGNVYPQVQEISTKQKVQEGAYYEDGHLIFETESGIQVLSISELPLLGRHNYYNQMAAILVATEMGVSFKDILEGLRSFKNVAHRLEVVAEVGGVLFINDSKATNVDAVFYALEAMTKDVIWIAGGVNKGNDYKQIKKLVQDKVRHMICLGRDNEHLIHEFVNDVKKYVEVKSADEAVQEAYRLAKPGDVVLLSPACASFDLFKNYENRGDLFKNAVLKLKETESKPMEV